MGMELTVGGTDFLISKLAEDLPDEQKYRELTKNGVEAIQEAVQAGLCDSGEVIVDRVDWPLRDGSIVDKAAITDTGIGMTPNELVHHLATVADSGKVQGSTDNFGVGGRISTIRDNPRGVVYRSKTANGVGHEAILWRNPETGRFELKQQGRKHGQPVYVRQLNGYEAEALGDHGTQVILLGQDDGDATWSVPSWAATSVRPHAHYLNTRFYRVPENVTLKARGFKSHANFTTVEGHNYYLDYYAQDRGTVTLEDYDVHWVILDDKAPDSGIRYALTKGHIGVLFQDELYEVYGTNELMEFGILHNTRRVALIIEPTVDGAQANLQRTGIVINGDKIAFEDIAAQFRAQMPQQIVDLEESGDSVTRMIDSRTSLEKLLSENLEWFGKMNFTSQFGAGNSDNGKVGVGSGNTAKAARRVSATSTSEEKEASKEAAKNSSRTVRNSQATPSGDDDTELQYPDLPDWHWVEATDADDDVLRNRAARYLPAQHEIVFNEKFGAYVDLTDRILEDFPEAAANAASRQVIVEGVKIAWERAVVETVLTAQALANSGDEADAETELRELTSPAALTGAALRRLNTARHARNIIRGKFRAGAR